jgi:tRNA nucleotidyltransferase (CCA-adding enzyme)
MTDRKAATGSAATAYWEHFDHDADIGVLGCGPSLEAAFEQAALALTAVVTDEAVAADTSIAITCEAPDAETLFVDWLNALVFEMATRSMLFSRFEIHIEQNHGWHLEAAACGEPVDRGRHGPAVEVKGATYTALSVKRRDDGTWQAGCVLDV